MTRRELLEDAACRLQLEGYDDARSSLRILFEDLIGVSPTAYYLDPDAKLSDSEEEAFREAVRRILAGEPLAYILGNTEFMGLRFLVTQDVLIPRQDTEHLVEWILEDFRGRHATVADICTGSGCIVESLLHYNPALIGYASDLSSQALSVAKRNAKALQVEDRLTFLEGDLFAAFPKDQQYDILVSNPPYISGEAMRELPDNVTHEPFMALYGGEDGLDFYRRIAEEAPRFLKPFGHLYFEIGWDQGQSVPEMLRQAGFTQTEVRRDYAGRDRCVKARWR